MSATSMPSKRAGRVRIMIVDPELSLGLRLADCLATSGYQAVLVRDLESTVAQLNEIQPEMILLSQDASDTQQPVAGVDTLQVINRLCPQAPVLALNRTTPGTMPGATQRSAPLTPIPPLPTLQNNVVEDVLRAQLGIPCMRLQ
ncbi:MAG: hypothetical protein JSR62_07520 [Nitrospira sp.]|nr:hypothetical protein [Nitrospira sp.]